VFALIKYTNTTVFVLFVVLLCVMLPVFTLNREKASPKVKIWVSVIAIAALVVAIFTRQYIELELLWLVAVACALGGILELLIVFRRGYAVIKNEYDDENGKKQKSVH